MNDKNTRILLVEDEEHLLDMIKLNLELEGYAVVAEMNGRIGLERARTQRFDLLILDVMLPGMDGFTLCKTLRVEGSEVPILFLTARQSGQDRVEGLKIGADDYLTKPFNLEELLLRVAKLLSRTARVTVDTSADIYRFNGREVNFKTFRIKDKNGEEVEVPKRELMLLKLLISKKGEVVSREEILETVWGYDVYPSTRTVDNYVMTLRKYFEDNPRQPLHIHSVRGVGYRFQP